MFMCISNYTDTNEPRKVIAAHTILSLSDVLIK